MQFVIVFLGAGLGGACRHAANVAALRLFGAGFPVSTLAVNVTGSFAMGLLVGWFAHRADPGLGWRLFLTTGFLGGFTTFSTFALDVGALQQRGEVVTALLYVLLSVGGAVGGFFAGMQLVRALG